MKTAPSAPSKRLSLPIRRLSLVEFSKGENSKSTLGDRIYYELKERILTGRIQPKQYLREQQLCESLKVSRTPLREALNRLGNEELILYRPNSGYSAAPLSSKDFHDLQDLRLIVEPKVAGLAAVRADAEDIQRLREAAPMPEVEPDNNESFVAFCQANARFHLLLVEASHNHLLANIVMSALDKYQRPAYLGIGRVSNDAKATACHFEIVSAIEDRDPMRAEAVMANHIVGGHRRIQAALVAAGL